ncbi:uncharacterized protein TNCV_2043361 [Trichonephila clavipes]|nr:uncharacterized protein TNCV_2043361 [Trichonephila clavipes]
MSPVELPYVPILLNDTFTKALLDTGAEKSFISEETYRKYFFHKPVKESRTQVITAHGAKCQNIGIVELNIRITEFEKPWLFYVLADLLEIPDSQIDKVVKTIEEEKVVTDLSKTKLEEKQKKELQDLFNSLKGLFSDKNRGLHMFDVMRLTREITHR